MNNPLTPTEFYNQAEKAIKEVDPELDKIILDYFAKIIAHMIITSRSINSTQNINE